MIFCDRIIIVEGKYDKIKLENIIDATIITTEGFGIFNDQQKREYIRKIAKKKGIAVLTDSDSAGFEIRNYIKNICGNTDIINVYIPQIKGKEKRKTTSGKEGILGVEGMSEKVILEAFKRAGIENTNSGKADKKITKQDMFKFKLSGFTNSKADRVDLAKFLNIPQNISSNAFLDVVNSLYSYNEFERQVKLWRQEADKK